MEHVCQVRLGCPIGLSLTLSSVRGLLRLLLVLAEVLLAGLLGVDQTIGLISSSEIVLILSLLVCLLVGDLLLD